MKNSLSLPISWGEVGLAALPGLWLAFQQGEVTRFNPVITSVITMAIVLGSIGMSLMKYHHLAPWCWPAFGALYWNGWYLWWLAAERVRSLHVLGSIVSFSISFFVLYWVYQQVKPYLTTWTWVLLSLLVLITSNAVLWYVGVMSNLWLLLTPIAIAIPFAKRYGLIVSLFVIAFEPAWIDILYVPKHALAVQLSQLNENSALRLEVALIMLTYLPFLGFLVVIPIGVLRSYSTKSQLAWLFLPSLLILASINLIRGLALTETSFEYSANEWIRYSLVVIQLWLP